MHENNSKHALLNKYEDNYKLSMKTAGTYGITQKRDSHGYAVQPAFSASARQEGNFAASSMVGKFLPRSPLNPSSNSK